MVNALWQGGAEAMMLQDQRVISTSAVRCVGNTLILQGRVYSPPYVITAIGDRGAMRSRARQRPVRREPARLVDRGRARLRRQERRPAHLPGLQRVHRARARRRARVVMLRGRRRAASWSSRWACCCCSSSPGSCGGPTSCPTAPRPHAVPTAGGRVLRAGTQAPFRHRRHPAGRSAGRRLRRRAHPAVRQPTTPARSSRAPGVRVLALGIGHYVGTAVPGQVGNFAIAGHRTTYGRPFHTSTGCVNGDRVVVETAGRPCTSTRSPPARSCAPPTSRCSHPVPDDPGAKATRRRSR